MPDPSHPSPADRDVTLGAARYLVDRDAAADRETDGSEQMPAGPPPMAGRMAHRTAWVDRVVDQAIARGDFDNLPLAGKPIPGIGARHDPDWWLKALIEREQISGVLPEALQLRTDDAVLTQRLDAQRDEASARELLEEFNSRILAARRQLMGGPPVVTPLRDVERELTGWRERRVVEEREPAPSPPKRSWWNRRQVSSAVLERGQDRRRDGEGERDAQDAADEQPGPPRVVEAEAEQRQAEQEQEHREDEGDPASR